MCVLYNAMTDGKCSNKVLLEMSTPTASDIVMLDKRIRQELECLEAQYEVRDGSIIPVTTATASLTAASQNSSYVPFSSLSNASDAVSSTQQASFQRITGSSTSLSPLRMGIHAAHRYLDPLVSPGIRKGSKATPADTKAIWIVTNNPVPTSDVDESSRLVQICRDGSERGIDLEVWGLPASNTQGLFDNALFYNKIVESDAAMGQGLFTFVPASVDNSSLSLFTPASQEQQQQEYLQFNSSALLSRIKMKQKKKRRITGLPLLLPGGHPGIHVDIYRLTQTVKRPGSILVNAKNNLPLRREVQLLSASTGDIVERIIAEPVHRSSNTDSRMDGAHFGDSGDDDGDGGDDDDGDAPARGCDSGLTTYIPLGNDRVPFSKADVDLIKKYASKGQPAGLRVLGFKRMSSLKIHERIDRSYFIYPDPTKFETGGRAALVALHASCLAKNVYALCELILRADTIPRLCALIPQLEERNSFNEQVKSDGFCLVVLPYEDDFREVVVAAEDSPADGEQIDAAQALISKLQLQSVEWGYSFSNPSLRRFWSYLETVAINYPAVDLDSLEDETIIDPSGVMDRAGQEIEVFSKVLPFDPLPEPKAKKKRPGPAPTKGAGASRKAKKVRVKKEEGTGEFDAAYYSESESSSEEEIDWECAFDSHTLKTHKLVQLKRYCEENGLKKSGNKGELVERISEAIMEARDGGEF
jgi:hypothetical protein